MVIVSEASENASSDTSNFQITVKELNDLMMARGLEAVEEVQRLGGVEALCHRLHTSPMCGINANDKDLKIRVDAFGSNILPKASVEPFWHLVCEATLDITVLMLISAALVSLIINYILSEERDDTTVEGEAVHCWIEGTAILVTVMVVVLVTAVNDYTKERQFQSLQDRIYCEMKFPVIRNSQSVEILVADIVVGDICQVKYGDIIPADGVLVHCNDLKVDESSLTGDSLHVAKGMQTDPFLLSGTNVMEGSGKMVVTAVGVHSQTGIIYTLMGAVRPRYQKQDRKSSKFVAQEPRNEVSVAVKKEYKSVLQRNLTELAIKIGYAGSTLAIFTVLVLIIKFSVRTFIIEKRPWNNAYYSRFLHFFIIGLTMLVVTISEGLPLAITIPLAYSVKQMMKDNNLVRNLVACEKMGYATNICSDKTGTLTTNRMTVVKLYVFDEYYETVNKSSVANISSSVVDLVTQAIAVNTNYSSRIIEANVPGVLPEQIGNKIECALLGFVLELGRDYRQLREDMPEKDFTKVYPYNSERKSMSTAIPLEEGYRLFVKGASEIILDKCSHSVDVNGKRLTLSQQMKNKIVFSVIEEMATEGLSTIAIAFRDFEQTYHRSSGQPQWNNESSIVNKLTLLCIVGIEDPVRPEVPEAIKVCQQAGITVRMVTGDNVITALSIASKCGIYKPGHLVLEGKEFNRMIRDDKGVVQQSLIDEVWPQLRVLARSSPTDKYHLVKGIKESRLTKKKEVVAVTGDGTNDGPALKVADVGFAMGVTGTDVAKEASDIILTDDNFTSIIKAVMWGRNIYDSITKFIQLTVNLVVIMMAFIGACTIEDSPFQAVQMLWINIIMDTLASLALATEKPNQELLRRLPYDQDQPLISNITYKNIIGQSVYQLAVLIPLIFSAPTLLNIQDTSSVPGHNSKHFTVVFNTFVMMTLFNELNTRKVYGERNILRGISKNPGFCIIWFGTFALQVLIVQYGGRAFSTHSLDPVLWFWCLVFGLGTLLWGQIITSVPPRKHSRWGTPDTRWRCDPTSSSMDPRIKTSILWLRGNRRLQTQLRAIGTFRTVDNPAKRMSFSLANHSNASRRSSLPSSVNKLSEQSSRSATNT